MVFCCCIYPSGIYSFWNQFERYWIAEINRNAKCYIYLFILILFIDKVFTIWYTDQKQTKKQMYFLYTTNKYNYTVGNMVGYIFYLSFISWDTFLGHPVMSQSYNHAEYWILVEIQPTGCSVSN